MDEGQSGRCLVRKNINGRILNPYAGHCSILAVEPIEKRPFFHFMPGTKFLSVGFYGCSFTCKFCQNFKVSQTVDGESLYKSPADIVQLVGEKNASGVAFTYNEPTIYYEYIQEVADKTTVVIKTNGFVTSHILDELQHVRAWNVDIKGDEREYDRICGGSLRPVLDTVEYLANQSHLEISYLVLPRLISDTNYHIEMRDRIASVSRLIPVHILYFFPVYQMQDEYYEQSMLLPIYELFRERLEYVYISNIYGEFSRRNTMCSVCGGTMITRSPKAVVQNNSCCGRKLTGVGINTAE